MEALGAAASVAGLISLAIEIPKLLNTAICIWSAPEEANQLSRTIDGMIVTLKKLEAFLKTSEARDMGMADDSALTIAISSCQTRVLDLSRKLRASATTPATTPVPAAQAAGAKLKKAVAMLRWPLDKKECLEIISELHALQSTFEFCLVMENCQRMSKSHKEVISHLQAQGATLSQVASSFPEQNDQVVAMAEKLRTVELCINRAAETADRVQVGVAELQEMKKDLARYHSEEMHGQALEWLSPIDPSTRHDEIKETRTPGTCNWILTQHGFKTWARLDHPVDATRSTCWVGNPGQGKTYTMSRVVDHLREMCSSEAGAYVSYLYLDCQRTQSYSLTSLLGAILRQLLSQFELMPTPVAEFIRVARLKNRKAAPRTDDIYRLLDRLCPFVKRLFICIDALDECADAGPLVSACQRLHPAASFFFIGRPSIAQTVISTFPLTFVHTMELQNHDIDVFVSLRLENEQKRQPDLTPACLASQIRSAILELSNGMFLLASLHTSLVLSHDTVHRRREALANLLPTIDGAFGQTLDRIRDNSLGDRAFRILAWLYYFGSISLTKLRYILAVEPHHTRFQHDNLPNPTTTLDCCLGLVKLDSLEDANSTTVAMVNFVHSSLTMYLDSNPNILEGMMPSLLGTCSAYLSFPHAERPDTIQPFIDYAWVRLLYAVRSPPDKVIDSVWTRIIAINNFINSNIPLPPRRSSQETCQMGVVPRKLIPLLDTHSTSSWAASEGRRQSMFHTSCMLGLGGISPILNRLSAIARQLSREETKKFSGPDSFGVSPLGWVLLPENASHWYHGSCALMSRFDTFGHNISKIGQLFQTFRDIDIKQPLWDARAIAANRKSDITYEDGATVSYTSGIPVSFLLENYWVAPGPVHDCIARIQHFLKYNFWSMFRPRHGDNHHRWSLVTFWASMGVTCAVFFEPGRDVPVLSTGDWQGRQAGTYMSSLPRAAVSAQPSMSLAQITVESAYVTRDLLFHLAAAADSMDVARAASSYGLDPNSLDPHGDTALHVALKNRSGFVTAFLIGYPGTNLGLVNSTGMSPLQVCVKQRMRNFVSLILDNYDGNVNARDQEGKTALHYATETGERRMVKLLLQHKASADIQDATGKTALHLGIIRRDTVICEIILEASSGTGFSVENLQTALCLAIDAGASFVMTVLRVIQTRSQPLLLFQHLGSNKSSLLNRPEVKALQVFVAAGQTTPFDEKDLDFMLKYVITKDPPGTAAVSSRTAVGLRRGNLPLCVPDPVRTIRSALVKGAQHVAAYLLQQFPIDLDHLGEDGESALHLAIVYDAPQVVHLLLTRHADATDLAHPDPEGYTAPQLAVIRKRYEILHTLLNAKVGRVAEAIGGVHRVTGSTVLTLAVKNRFTEALPLLLACPHIDVNSLDRTGRAAIHHAVLQQNTATVKLFVECPRVNAALVSADGRSALAFAALCADEAMVTMLLGSGKFDLDSVDTYGKKAVHWARLNTCGAVEALLREAGTRKQQLDGG